MASGLPPGGTLAAVWERASHGRKVTRVGTTAFGTRTSAEGRPLLREREASKLC